MKGWEGASHAKSSGRDIPGRGKSTYKCREEGKRSRWVGPVSKMGGGGGRRGGVEEGRALEAVSILQGKPWVTPVPMWRMDSRKNEGSQRGRPPSP